MMTINQWKEQVLNYNNALNKELKQHKIAQTLYYGFEVIDGKIINNPEILFVGINPGKGEGKHNFKVKFEGDYLSYLEPFYPKDVYKKLYPNKYHLAEKTLRYFRTMGWDDDKIKAMFTNKTVKTNFYHIATENGATIDKTLNLIGKKSEYYKKSAAFMIQLIEIIKPKVVILEGKTVYNLMLAEWHPNKKDWKNNGFTHVVDKKLNTTFISYKRTGFTVKNRTDFAQKLKEILK